MDKQKVNKNVDESNLEPIFKNSLLLENYFF